MLESDTLHAICADTTPSIVYMNDTSRKIVAFVHELNTLSTSQGRGNIAAYSIDAGFHVFLFTLKENLEEVREGIKAKEDLSSGIERLILTSIDRDGVTLKRNQ